MSEPEIRPELQDIIRAMYADSTIEPDPDFPDRQFIVKCARCPEYSMPVRAGVSLADLVILHGNHNGAEEHP